mmetsp:Transcript_26032/g.72760  ORF Transcript_26032/g.72760 Transcript_26032/m.72760 type:complete len:307 (+) Transcript_26032:85-1005(+)
MRRIPAVTPRKPPKQVVQAWLAHEEERKQRHLSSCGPQPSSTRPSTPVTQFGFRATQVSPSCGRTCWQEVGFWHVLDAEAKKPGPADYEPSPSLPNAPTTVLGREVRFPDDSPWEIKRHKRPPATTRKDIAESSSAWGSGNDIADAPPPTAHLAKSSTDQAAAAPTKQRVQTPTDKAAAAPTNEPAVALAGQCAMEAQGSDGRMSPRVSVEERWAEQARAMGKQTPRIGTQPRYKSAGADASFPDPQAIAISLKYARPRSPCLGAPSARIRNDAEFASRPSSQRRMSRHGVRELCALPANLRRAIF